MLTRTRWPQWISVAAALALLLGAHGAAARPAAAVQAGPPFPNAPTGGPLFVPANCSVEIAQSYNLVPQIIPDLGVVTSTIQITDSVPYVWDLLVSTSITHTASGDLNIDLISPAGTVVTLAHHLGGTHHDVFSDTVWSDYNGLPATEADYSVSHFSLSPEESLAAVQGQNGTGPWRLVISDDLSNDAGKLLSWYLEVIGLNGAPITTTQHFSQTHSLTILAQNAAASALVVTTTDTSLVQARLITSITSPNAGQLALTLGAPLLGVTTISDHEGFGHANWFAGTQWYDQAGAAYPPGPVAMETSLYPTSPLTATVPEGALGRFLGLNPNGQWSLNMSNDALATAATLNSWSLDVTTGHCLAHQYLPVTIR